MVFFCHNQRWQLARLTFLTGARSHCAEETRRTYLIVFVISISTQSAGSAPGSARTQSGLNQPERWFTRGKLVHPHFPPGC